MKYFYLKPEVGGGMGENTILDRSVHPPIVSKLHYEFYGWLGDVLQETFPCFIVTEDARDKLLSSGLTGFYFDDVEITESDEYEEMKEDGVYPELPDFAWLRISGQAGHDDFGTAPNAILIVSKRALDFLQVLGIPNAEVKPFEPPI